MTTAIITGLRTEGPIPVDAASGPLYGGAISPIGLNDPTVEDLLPPHDYVEQEYFVSGSALGQPYTTTLLVRRPRDPAKFSGLVALEPVHVQGALGLWQTSHAAILEGGHAWVAVGSQRAGLEGPIKLSNPARYAALDVPLPNPADGDAQMKALVEWEQGNSTDIPDDLFAMDSMSNAIMTQVGALLKGNTPDGPLAGLSVRYLIMGGASQTGVATLNYLKETGGAETLPNGQLVYDGYLPLSASGWEPVAPRSAPVIQIFAEGDMPLFGSIGPQGYLAARPDSDAADDRFRSYHVTGASHLPTRGLRDLDGLPLFGVTLESGERFIQFPAAPFYQAAFVNLVDWVVNGVPPPHAPAIEIADGQIVTDELGNAKGGLRSPYVDVAIARHVPARYVRNLIGVELPFAPERLQALYGSWGSYLERFDQGIDALVAGRLLRGADGERLKAEEAATAPSF